MSRNCVISGKKVLVGNNVSHANNKTKRRFIPNLQNATFFSNSLGRNISLRLATKAIRTIDSKGGIDNFVKQAKLKILPPELYSLKNLLEKQS